MPTTRQPLEDPPAAPGARPTANKDYWLFFERIARQIAANGDSISKGQSAIEDLSDEIDALSAAGAQLIQSGTHAARLAIAPASLPMGSLWMETDRTNVVYQVQQIAGAPAWVYVAGVMTGSFSQLARGSWGE